MAEQPALDAAQLLGALSRHGVDCVLIGGVAVQAYGTCAPRLTST